MTSILDHQPPKIWSFLLVWSHPFVRPERFRVFRFLILRGATPSLNTLPPNPRAPHGMEATEYFVPPGCDFLDAWPGARAPLAFRSSRAASRACASAARVLRRDVLFSEGMKWVKKTRQNGEEGCVVFFLKFQARVGLKRTRAFDRVFAPVRSRTSFSCCVCCAVAIAGLFVGVPILGDREGYTTCCGSFVAQKSESKAL